MTEDRMTKGRQARLVKSTMTEWLIDQENAIIDRLVVLYEQGTLTNKMLRGTVGELAFIRRTLNSFDTDITRGIAEEKKEFADADDRSNNGPGADI